ncbi:MAG: hypothetical protein P8Y54_03165 [Xanthomonadales bacterium]
MRMFLIPLLLSFTVIALAADEGFSTLEEQMTGREFSAAGLDKLTPDELGALNNWIRRHSLATLATPASDGAANAPNTEDDVDRRGLPSDPGDDERPITSRLVGDFSGWDGQSVFKLENGMIWVQADRDKFYIKETENPAITITPGLFKSWYLSVDGYDEKCKVRRIQ